MEKLNMKENFQQYFGFVDKQLYEKVMDEYEQYIGFKKAINGTILNKLHKKQICDSRNLPFKVENALIVVNTIANAEEDGMLDCLTDNMVHYLIVAMLELTEYQSTLEVVDSQIQACIDYAKLTIEDLPRITLCKDDFQKRFDKKSLLSFYKFCMNKDFDWNEENISNLLKLNEVLTELMAKARKHQKEIECDIKNLLASGKNYYEDFSVDTYIYYDYSVDDSKTIGLDYCDYMNEQLKLGWCPDSFSNDLDELSWNIELLKHPALKDQNLCYAMHIIFDHAYLPLQYGLLLQLERFTIQSEINL